MTDIKEYEGLSSDQQLNLFRNLHYNDGNATELGIIANAINDFLPEYTRQKAENSNLSSDLTSLKKDLTSAKAEIERLKGNAPKLFISDKTPSRYFKVKSSQPILIYPYEEAKIELVPSTEQTKAEAIKDFAERLTHALVINNEENTEFFDFSYTLETIDNLVKETTGEQE